jgi:2-oxoglutarate ferredoxin oxidoreductase subunit alpha
LVIGWGGTYGAISSATRILQDEGYSISSIHLRHLNPLPNDLGPLLSCFKKVIVPELNLGQLSTILKAQYVKEIIPYNKIQGKPFKVAELRDRFVQFF